MGLDPGVDLGPFPGFVAASKSIELIYARGMRTCAGGVVIRGPPPSSISTRDSGKMQTELMYRFAEEERLPREGAVSIDSDTRGRPILCIEHPAVLVRFIAFVKRMKVRCPPKVDPVIL